MLSQQDSERLDAIQQELKNLQKVFVQFQNKADLLAHEVSQIAKRSNLTTTTSLESKTEIYASTEQIEQPITPPKLPQEEPIIPQNTFANYFHTTTEEEEEAATAQTPFNWEDYIGGNILGKIGMLLLLISIGFFINYAIENDLIGPVGRVVLAYSAGGILIGLAYWLKSKYLNYSALLMGGGLATAYFTTYFTYLLFGYFSQGLSFGLMFLITLYAVIEALRYNKQVIGLFGLVAAYAIPLFLSNQSGNITIFFAYILLINGGILFLAFRKKWYLLYYTAFAFTWLIFLGWFNAKYTPADFNTALSFSFLFFFTFFLLLLINQLLAEKPESFLWIMANGLIFYGIGFVLHSQAGQFNIFAQDAKSLPLVGFTLLNSLFYAISASYVYLRTRQTSNLWGVLVLQSLFFFTLSVPIYLSVHATLTVWALEVLAIFALNLKLQQFLFHQTAILLALVLQIAFFAAINAHYSKLPETNSQALFLNSFFFSYFVVVLILFITSRIPKPTRFTQIDTFWKGEWIFWVAIFFSYYIVVAEISHYYENQIRLIYSTINLETNEKINAQKYQYIDVLGNFSKVWRYLAVVVLTGFYAVILQRKTTANTPLQLFNFTLIGLFIFFVFISASLNELRRYYLDFLISPTNVEFPPTLMYWAVRILVYAALAGLVVWQWRLHVQAKSLYNIPEGRTLFLCTLAWVLWVLSDELLSIVLFQHTSSTEALLDAQKQVMKIGFTILWVAYSSLCIAWGIFKKRKLFRFAGFGIFAIALVKIFIFDISYASTLSKIIVFFSVALLFLIVSFAYQRYKDIILAPDE